MKLKSLKIELLLAVAVLVIMLAAIGGATYAWFALNKQVTATDMDVTVKSNGTYMFIKAGHYTDADAVQGFQLIQDSAETPTRAITPAAHDTITNIADADTASKWYYKTSDDPALYGGEGHESEKTLLSALENGYSFEDYVSVNEFSITVEDNGQPLNDIRVEQCTIYTPNGGKRAVKVLVAGPTGAEEFSGTGGAGNGTALAASVDPDHVVNVKVYIYWDGTNDQVTSNNLIHEYLKATSVEIVFTGTIQNL